MKKHYVLIATAVALVLAVGGGVWALTAGDDESPDATATTLATTTSTTAAIATTTTMAASSSTTTSATAASIYGGTDCGPVQTVEPNQKLIAVRGVACDAAKATLKEWDAYQATVDGSGSAPSGGWGCFNGRVGDGYTLVCATEFPDDGAAKSAAHVFILVNQ